jgi:hypothetical protein
VLCYLFGGFADCLIARREEHAHHDIRLESRDRQGSDLREDKTLIETGGVGDTASEQRAMRV